MITQDNEALAIGETPGLSRLLNQTQSRYKMSAPTQKIVSYIYN